MASLVGIVMKINEKNSSEYYTGSLENAFINLMAYKN